MELRPLRHVIALARHLHYTKAADELGLTQPALTRSIQVTEERYGARLFDRDRSGVHLTAVGKLFVHRAQALIREAADFERSVGRFSDGEEGHVTFGVSPSSARAFLPRLLRELLSERPEIYVNVAVRRTSSLISMLMSEDIEFLICAKGEMPPSADVISVPIGSHSACMLVRAGHPLLSDDKLEVSQFPIIATGPFRGGDAVLDGLVDVFGHQPQMTVESTEALARLAEQSDSVWLSSTLAAADELAKGSLVKVERGTDHVNHPLELRLYSLRQRSTSPIAKEICDRLDRIFASIRLSSKNAVRSR